MAFDLRRWSHSALALLQECGEAFRRRYIEGEGLPSSLRQVRGSTIHAVAHLGFARTLRRQVPLVLAEARDLAADQFDALCRRGLRFEPEELEAGVDKSTGAAKDFAVKLSAYHLQHVAPTVNPIRVERRIVVKPKDSDITIVGKMDLVDKRPTGEWVRDLKSGEHAPARTVAETSQQLTTYALLRWAEVGTLPERLALDYLIRTPSGRESYAPYLTQRSAEDVQGLVRRINVAVSAVSKGIFVPTNPDSWKCSERFCEFFNTCPYPRRSTRPRS